MKSQHIRHCILSIYLIASIKLIVNIIYGLIIYNTNNEDSINRRKYRGGKIHSIERPSTKTQT